MSCPVVPCVRVLRLQRTPAWVLPRSELMPRYAVPAAQHAHGLTLWLQRQAVYWRSELLVGAALTRNNQKLLRQVGLQQGAVG